MGRFIRTQIAVALAAASACCWATVGARAQEETADLDVAAFAGQASVSPPVQLIGGGGSFSLTSTLPVVGNVCAMGSADAPAAGESEPPLPGVVDAEATSTCTLSADGTYASLACGTGVLAGSGTLTEGSSDTYTLTEFTVTLVAGVGILVGLADESEIDGGGLSGSAPIAGVLLMAPVPAATVPPACATSFVVTGALATTA